MPEDDRDMLRVGDFGTDVLPGRSTYGGQRLDQRYKDLERENDRFRSAVSEERLDKLVLKEA